MRALGPADAWRLLSFPLIRCPLKHTRICFSVLSALARSFPSLSCSPNLNLSLTHVSEMDDASVELTSRSFKLPPPLIYSRLALLLACGSLSVYTPYGAPRTNMAMLTVYQTSMRWLLWTGTEFCQRSQLSPRHLASVSFDALDTDPKICTHSRRISAESLQENALGSMLWREP